MKTPSWGHITVIRSEYSLFQTRILFGMKKKGSRWEIFRQVPSRDPPVSYILWHCCSVGQWIGLPNVILVLRDKGCLLKLERQSSRSILTATFCHLVFRSAIINDVISTKLIKGRGRKFPLRFKEWLFYSLVKAWCPYHVPSQRC